MTKRELSVGEYVISVDSKGRDHDALITCIHGGEIIEDVVRDDGTSERTTVEFDMDGYVPCVNLVYVSGVVEKQDCWGRQLERESSFPHKSDQGAHGQYWRFPDEEPNPRVAAHS